VESLLFHRRKTKSKIRAAPSGGTIPVRSGKSTGKGRSERSSTERGGEGGVKTVGMLYVSGVLGEAKGGESFIELWGGRGPKGGDTKVY